ncbi:sensor histidine kinase [Microbacterium sp.]|uniref:sensor histidine kinase n=1 Tax=Microbacterium sp. TaxID=51671 RepID=UPI003A83A97D
MSMRSAFAPALRRPVAPIGSDATGSTAVTAIAVTALLFPVTAVTLFVLYPTLPVEMKAWYTTAASAVHVGTLVGSRRPRAGLVVASLGMLGLVVPILPDQVGLTAGILAPSSCAYLLSVWQGGVSERPGLPAVTIAVALTGDTLVAVLYGVAYPGVSSDPTAALVAWAAYGIPIIGVFGAATAVRRRRILRREQDATHRREAVHAERAAIRHDLHDIVSHSLTVMIAQAEAARVTATDADTDARLEGIAGTGREALRGLRGMLTVLSDSEQAGPAPAPTPTDLRSLVTSAATAHHRTHITVDGHARPLTPEASLALYRGVQEALTNAIRHVAPPVEIEVSVTWDAAHVTARVHDDGGAGPSARVESSGSGLIGMAERVRAAGGTVELSRRAGWTVTIALPVDSE